MDKYDFYSAAKLRDLLNGADVGPFQPQLESVIKLLEEQPTGYEATIVDLMSTVATGGRGGFFGHLRLKTPDGYTAVQVATARAFWAVVYDDEYQDTYLRQVTSPLRRAA
jgi:hypothetical protein